MLLIHLHHAKSILVWYDLLMLFCFANTGLLLAILSMHTMHIIIQKKWNKTIANLFSIVFSFLTGYGVYLGRFLRFNSWDIINTPLNLLKNILLSFTNTETWSFTIAFGMIILLIFIFFKKTFVFKKNL